MLAMGLQDAWRRVHPEPEVAEEVGPARGDRHIDRVVHPPCVSKHIQSVFTTPVGGADHQAVVVRLAPTVDRKK